MRYVIAIVGLLCFSTLSSAAERLILNEQWEELPPAATGPALELTGPELALHPDTQGEHRAVDYRYRHPRHGKFCKSETTTITLLINDPCTDCLVEVAVCVPDCCLKDAPEICWSKGAFKREVATYSWPCGYDVRIAFRNRKDALIVTYSELQR